MSVTAKDFINGKELVFVGYSGNGASFSRSVYRDFVDAGCTVYPVNVRAFTDGNVKVYGKVSDIGAVPKSAFVILNVENARKAVAELIDAGVKRIWFQGTMSVDSAILETCRASGVETMVGCAKMYLSKGLIHRFHGFVAGAKR